MSPEAIPGMTTAQDRPILTARRLCVGYSSVPVLSGIDTFVRPGGTAALVGANGSGKSTLLKTFAGLLTPVSGALEVAGASHHDLAYLSQFHDSGFVLPLRTIDVVRMARFDQRPRLARRTRADDLIVAESMERMGVLDFAETALRDLSGGQRQRVYLAQVLARRSRLLLLDEPTANLDAPGRALYLEALASEKARGAAVISATHDVGEAALCDRVILLSRRVVADGPPVAVLTPENLMETFGIGLTRVGDRLVVTEHAHDGHSHDGHSHDGHGH
ncbi:MAG: metal ABC transporter ATP-binding protein [Actinomycetota bacterium]